MKYRVTHSTKYNYSEDVTLCHNVAHLLPRNTETQDCRLSELKISPLPVSVNEWTDLFGNRQASFSIQKPHDELIVTAISEVEVSADDSLLDDAFPISCEQTIMHMLTSDHVDSLDARMYLLESDFIEFSDSIKNTLTRVLTKTVRCWSLSKN